MPKIIKIGNSLGITLSAQDLEALDLKAGDEVVVQRRGSHLEVVPVVMRPKLRPELQRIVDEGVAEFGPALERLAK